jgi:glycosyltransferase involved in cell wall biosynthesis
MDTTKVFAGKHTVLVIENEAVPFDRRMWNIALALRDAGARVSVICPVFGKDDEIDTVLEGVSIHRYPNIFADGSVKGYLREYFTAFVKTVVLVHKLLLRGRIHVVHAANPPDIFWPLALYLKLFRTRFIFDEHDLAPEAYLSRFEKSAGHVDLLYRIQRLFQWLSYRFADAVLSTNLTYQGAALTRLPHMAARSFVVRNGPDTRIFYPRVPTPELRRGRKHMAAFIGVMAVQDGVDYILRAVDELVHRKGLADLIVYLIGKGDDWERLQSLSATLKIQEHVVFTGRIPDKEALDILSTADICLSPDPFNPLNDLSTMTKVMEYMALGKPVVSFHLKENTYSAGEAALYVENNDASAFAGGMLRLFRDPDLCRTLGETGMRRIQETFAWQKQVTRLYDAYASVLSR